MALFQLDPFVSSESPLILLATDGTVVYQFCWPGHVGLGIILVTGGKARWNLVVEFPQTLTLTGASSVGMVFVPAKMFLANANIQRFGKQLKGDDSGMADDSVSIERCKFGVTFRR